MPRYKPEFLASLQRATETIAARYTELKRHNGELWGRCPFPDHVEKSPSFHIMASGKFKCFGCGAHGDGLDLIQKIDGATFHDAVLTAAQWTGLPVAYADGTKTSHKNEASLKQKILEAHRLLQDYFRKQFLKKENAAVRAYVLSRGLPPKETENAGLGYAPVSAGDLPWRLVADRLGEDTADASGLFFRRKNPAAPGTLRWNARLMIPLHDPQGRVAGFTGRLLPDSAGALQPNSKYINSPNTLVFNKGEFLFHLHIARRAPVPEGLRTLLVEGQIDALQIAARGHPSVVATQGTSITAAHIEKLAAFPAGILCLLDGDAAGKKGMLKILPDCLKANLDIRFALLPPGADPASFLKSKTSDNALEALRELHRASLPPVGFALATLIPEAKPTAAALGRATDTITQWLLAANTPAAVQEHLRELAAATGLDPAAVWENFKKQAGFSNLEPKTRQKEEIDIPALRRSLERCNTIIKEGLAPMLNETEQKLIRLTATTARPGIQALIEGRQTAAHCRVILAHAALLSPAETARIQNLLADAEAITGGTDGSA